MVKPKMFLFLSVILTGIVSIIYYYYFLLAYAYRGYIIQRPTLFGSVLEWGLLLVPIFFLVYQIILLFLENKLSKSMVTKLNYVFGILALPYSLFFWVYHFKYYFMIEKVKIKEGVLITLSLIFWIIMISAPSSNHAFITNYRESYQVVTITNEDHAELHVDQFYTKIFYFNERYDYHIIDYDFYLDSETINYNQLNYDYIEYDILVNDVYMCENIETTSHYIEYTGNGCTNLFNENDWYETTQFKVTFNIRIMKEDILIIESSYTIHLDDSITIKH